MQQCMKLSLTNRSIGLILLRSRQRMEIEIPVTTSDKSPSDGSPPGEPVDKTSDGSPPGEAVDIHRPP